MVLIQIDLLRVVSNNLFNMEIDVIDYGTYVIPTKWEDITLRQFSELERYYSDKEMKFDAREVLHILTNKTVDEINNLPIEFTEKLMSKLEFLEKAPEEKEPTNKIKIDGETYVINVMEHLKTGEYVAVDSAMKNDKFDYATFLAILCRKEGEVFDSKFEAELFEKRREMFEKQPITNILPIVSFFLNLYILLQTPSQVSSLLEEELNRIQRLIETSPKIGVFKKRSLNLQMKKLRKSLKSNKNT